MTKDEALKLALEALVEMSPSGPIGSEIWHKQMNAIRVAGDALAQSAAFEQGRQEGMKQARGQPVQPEHEPVAWEQFHEHLVERNFCPRCGKRTADLTTIHTCTPPREKDV